ncbi:MAG: F-box protein: endocytic membrane traffic, recycling ReCYcling 1 [Piccolia ochrophora]|nr:MAG: F-box protein: endocytic membrane traffic, recycling ReCYcling 1 [Piccolia ochrophora]
MSSFKRANVAGGPPKEVPSPLRVADIVVSKPVLPAEILSLVLDYVPIPDLLHFARVSRRMREMVYDDTRWVHRLRLIGCWNEAEARKRVEDALRRKQLASKVAATVDQHGSGAPATEPPSSTPGVGGAQNHPSVMFDAGAEASKNADPVAPRGTQKSSSAVDDFGPLQASSTGTGSSAPARPPSNPDPASALNILSKVLSVRGHAREEYGRVHRALAPFYFDLVRAKNHTDPVLFKKYPSPNEQAQMLAQLTNFAKGDIAVGWEEREEKLRVMLNIFENALLREFERAIGDRDVDGRMRTYAHVLVALNGGQSGVDLFVKEHPLFLSKAQLGDPMDCLSNTTQGSVSLVASQEFFDRLSSATNAQSGIIDRIFPPSVNPMRPFLGRVGNDILAEYITSLFDEAHTKNIQSYLKAFSGIFEQCIRFIESLQASKASLPTFAEDTHIMLTKIFEPHVDLYLQEELHMFTKKSDAEVSSWERKLSEQDASTESFFMANVNRQADKRDFLTSFKKVVMMPVSVLPTPFASGKSTTTHGTTSGSSLDPTQGALSQPSTRPGTPGNLNGNAALPGRSVSPGPEAPTTELAAKAAIMNSKLEGIRSLFSLEVALNLVHSAKASIERAAILTKLGGQLGVEAKEQCEAVFVHLLQILGARHIRAGFNTAVDHLSQYNPRHVNQRDQPGVTPLMTFLELVNVGDLIQQMVDVFYEQELVANNLTDRNDFLDPAVKEKKRFEQMLDERVAAGLNKGIDVLMDEVEYICATTQAPTDFNPGATGDANIQTFDIGPSETAKRIVDVVSSHTKMLVGSTDKNMLDVFNQEVGLRLFTALCKHIKRQRISVDGSIKLISDMNHYFTYIQTLRNNDLLQYFKALRELSQVYLIDAAHAKEMATIIADGDRFYGIFRAEEVYEFAERRADWYVVKKGVERAMYGIGCEVM